jgi:hypothetical protein
MMSMLQRVLAWAGALALVVCVFVINGSVSALKTTVQGHTATLDKPVLETAVFPGVPAAFADRWDKATHGTALTPQDHLWLTLYITNLGQSQARSIAADLVLPLTISAIYPGGEVFVGPPAVVAESMGQTRATFSFLSLAPGKIHTVFIAVRPDGIAGPPYEVAAQRQWVAQHRAYWEHFTVTVEKHTSFVQYGFAPPLRVHQAANDPAGTRALPEAVRSAARSTP